MTGPTGRAIVAAALLALAALPLWAEAGSARVVLETAPEMRGAVEAVLAARLRAMGRDARIETAGPGRLELRLSDAEDPGALTAALTRPGRLTIHRVRDDLGEDCAAPPPGVVCLETPEPAGGRLPVHDAPVLGPESIARVERDEGLFGTAAVLHFTREGARVFCALTEERDLRRLAILLDGALLIAPGVAERVCGGRVQIHGDFQGPGGLDVDGLTTLLVAGPLPSELRVISIDALPRPASTWGAALERLKDALEDPAE